MSCWVLFSLWPSTCWRPDSGCDKAAAAAAQIGGLTPPRGLFLGALSLEVVQAPQGLADKPPADPLQSSQQIKAPV